MSCHTAVIGPGEESILDGYVLGTWPGEREGLVEGIREMEEAGGTGGQGAGGPQRRRHPRLGVQPEGSGNLPGHGAGHEAGANPGGGGRGPMVGVIHLAGGYEGGMHRNTAQPSS